MIFEDVIRFIARAGELVFQGRNKTRIVLGTDRKDTPNSGFGAGGRNSLNAGAIDIVAGGNSENTDFQNDTSRVYLSAKSNPDEYANINQGRNKTETGCVIVKSDQVYISARQNIKIVNGSVAVLIDENGNLTIETTNGITLKSGQGSMQINNDGTVSLGREGSLSERVLTENSVGTVIVPGSGPTPCVFNSPTSVITNNSVRVRI